MNGLDYIGHSKFNDIEKLINEYNMIKLFNSDYESHFENYK